MSRFLLITSDPDFARRMQLATAGLPGAMHTFTDVRLPESPGELLRAVPGGEPEVIVLGPGVVAEDALHLAAVLDVQHPEISAVLVCDPGPDLALAAMRAGIRDLVDPLAETDTLRVVLERACHSAASRRRGLAPTAPLEGPTGRVITVTAPKGGVGKTTVATNLAVGLGGIAPMSTVLVDLDAQFGDVATALGIDPEHTLLDAVSGAAPEDTLVLKAFLSVHPSSIYALAAPLSPAHADRITGDDVTHLIRQLASEFQYVVIDTAPGLGEHVLAALEASTDAVLLCGMDVPSVRGLRKQTDVLGELSLLPQSRHVVVNIADRHSGLSVRDIEATLGQAVDIVVPRSRAVVYSINKGEPLLQNPSRDAAAKALRRLVARFDPQSAGAARSGLHKRADLK